MNYAFMLNKAKKMLWFILRTKVLTQFRSRKVAAESSQGTFNDIFFFSIVLGGAPLNELALHIDKNKLFVKKEK